MKENLKKIRGVTSRFFYSSSNSFLVRFLALDQTAGGRGGLGGGNTVLQDLSKPNSGDY